MLAFERTAKGRDAPLSGSECGTGRLVSLEISFHNTRTYLESQVGLSTESMRRVRLDHHDQVLCSNAESAVLIVTRFYTDRLSLSPNAEPKLDPHHY